jgi:hypothetical protein
MSDRFPRSVVCVWCGNRHRSVLPTDIGHDTQGDACAASVFRVDEIILERIRLVAGSMVPIAIGEWLVHGNYGSSDYDCKLFRFVQNVPSVPADPVCDNCIGERLVVGDLERIEGHFP